MEKERLLKILKFGGIGFTPEEHDEAWAFLVKELEVLSDYRELFNKIISQEENLEYDTAELKYYYDQIESNLVKPVEVVRPAGKILDQNGESCIVELDDDKNLIVLTLDEKGK